jgi:hypothetical protein
VPRRSPGDRTSPLAEWRATVSLSLAGSYRAVSNFSFCADAEGRRSVLPRALKRLKAVTGGADEPDKQKRASSSARMSIGMLSIGLIFSLLANGLEMSVGTSGGEVGGAVAQSDQVAPGGCSVPRRSPGDRG